MQTIAHKTTNKGFFMNEQIEELATTIKKIDLFKILDETKLEDGSKAFKFNYENEMFFLLLKGISENHTVINITNPISFEKERFSKPKLFILNEFNTYAAGIKGLLADDDKSHFLFVREEIIHIKDNYNKDLVETRVSLAIDLVKNAVNVFLSINDEINENA